MWVYVSVIIAVLWVMEESLKDINNNLSYLIELLEQNHKVDDNEQADKDKEQDNQISSREDFYK